MYKPESYERHLGKYLFPKQRKYNTSQKKKKKCPNQPCEPIHLHLSEHSVLLLPSRHSNLYLNQAHADTRDSVTTSVTLHYLCHSVS